MKTFCRTVLLGLLSFFFCSTILHAATVPVFDWVAAYNSTVINAGAAAKVIAVDPSDGGVITGARFSGTNTDLDPSGNSDLFTAVGGRDAFITKYSADGTYEWSKTWGGSGNDNAGDAVVLSDGTIVVVGTFSGTVDFDPGAGTNNKVSSGDDDVFISFFDADGTYQSTLIIGGVGADAVTNLNEQNGVLYLVGTFVDDTIDLDPGAGTSNVTSAGSFDVFLTVLSSDGTFQWGKSWGGSGFDFPTSGSFAIDSEGSTFVSFAFGGTVDFDPSAGTNNLVSNGSFDVGVAKLSSDGTFQWAKSWGDSGFDYVGGIISDSQENVYFQGNFSGTVDFDPGAGTSNATSNGAQDISFSKFSSDGTFQWVKTWGGSGSETGNDVFIDEAGDFVLLGDFQSTVDFDPGVGTGNRTSGGGREVYINHLTLDGDYIGTQTFGGTGDEWLDRGQMSNVSSSEKLYIIGSYRSAPTDFDPSLATANFSSDGDDVYLNVFNLIEPTVDISQTSGSLEEAEENSFTYDLVLNAPPSDDVVITITPDTQITTDLSEITFASTTWDVPQTVTVTVVDDSLEESTPHRGRITHTSTSDDVPFDGLSIDGVVITITENDFYQGGFSSGGSDNDDSEEEETPDMVDTPFVPSIPLTPGVPLTPEQKAVIVAEITAKIEELKAEIVKILIQKIEELRDQLAELLAKQAE